ncbi:protein of unknown function [Taphrina deformans PYCC 5710]|uniref:alpha-D-xyloside xylohydrolase n=1 Tax=Taphrina deformans (strain PYCC 5710 / ATCC 11124 / CBS 356.35 / IMI 108563 / JCM 9778 / NBRC 8474) TaxID=1097556 RepID=R4XFH0_TAPDE|nr:protein of unknown function [Taphrina deformans PYCC 5710]|eukprot:CCG84521.1 protein of unknown function [Taphrina deformans PYCC 5710]
MVKFTEGMWHVPVGVKHQFMANVVKSTTTSDSAKLLLSKHLRGRGDQLNCTTLNLDITSPMPDVISLKLTHWKGKSDLGPNFELATGASTAESKINAGVLTYTSGRLTAKVNTNENSLAIDFLDDSGERLTGNGFRSLGYVEDIRRENTEDSLFHEHAGHVEVGMDIDVNEKIYGLGERFGPFVKNGQTVFISNEDGGTSSEMTYKNIPFYLTSKGYGVFVRHSGQISFEVQSERTTRTNISVQDQNMEYIIIYGPDPKDIIQKYTRLTGRPTLPPSWAYHLWLTTSFTTDYDEGTVNTFLDGFKSRDMPLGVFHFDCFWMKGFEWCNFEFDTDMFPDARGQIRRIKERSMNVCVWINSYVAQESRLFSEGQENGYFIKKLDDSVWQTNWWQAGMAIVDFTNPEACSWYQGYLEKLVDMGITSFKTDFGERIPIKGVKYHNGADPARMHNYYTLLYNKTVNEVLEKKLGKGKGCLFARSATTGGQQYPVHWGGDCESTFVAMAETLRGGLSLGLCGFGFWAHDIGGFEGTPPAAVYKRWVQFGLLSSHSRLHGSGSYRVPWIYDDEACDVLRTFTKLKISLTPYLFSCAKQAVEAGTPVLRALFLEFPSDKNVWTVDTQYMLGPNLLVCPIFNESGKVSFYVPDDGSDLAWTSFLDGKKYRPGQWYDETHDFFSLPLLIRPNSAIVINKKISKPEENITEGLEIKAGEANQAYKIQIINGEGAEMGVCNVNEKNSQGVFELHN